MGLSVHNDVLDAAFDVIRDNCNEMMANNAEPTTRTEAITTFMLADQLMASTDFTIGEGDTSGRKVAVAAKLGATVDSTGTATHVSLVDGTRLLYVTTCTTQVLTAANTVDFPTWDIEILDPA